jgi:hypothetical protein
LAALRANLLVQRPITTREHYEGLAELAALSEARKITPVIDRQVPLAMITEAMRVLEAGRVCGKVVVTSGEPPSVRAAVQRTLTAAPDRTAAPRGHRPR